MRYITDLFSALVKAAGQQLVQLTGDRFQSVLGHKPGVETDSQQHRNQRLVQRRGIGVGRQLATLDRVIDGPRQKFPGGANRVGFLMAQVGVPL